MESRMREMLQFCRFCLSRSDLNYLTKAKDSSFTTQDIEHYTGIRISDEEKSFSAICDQCYSILEKSIAFRKACLRNDILFKQLLTAHSESFEETIEFSDNYNHFDDTTSVEIEKDETQRLEITSDVEVMLNTEEEKDETEKLLITSDEDGGILNIEEEKDETQKLFQPSDVDEGIPKTEEDREIESTDEHEEDTNVTEDEIQVNPTKRWKHRIRLCSICGKLVKNLNGHNKNHNKEKKYSCPHCQMKMSNSTNMKRHIEAVHEKKNVIYCEQCGKGFTAKYSYTSHMMSLHGIGKTFECTICSKKFNTNPRYRAHMNKWHTIQKEVSCTICQMKFRSNKQLAIHQRVHSTDQPFACDHCPKRFKSPRARKLHQLTHSGIRFSCTLCKKSYSYKTLLTMHLRKDHHDTLSDSLDVKNEDN